MIGFMTAWVDKTFDAAIVESKIYNVIENYSKAYTTDEGVVSVSYVGNNPVGEMSEAELAFNNNGDNRAAIAPGVLAVAGIAVASVLALLLVAFALVARRKRGNKPNVENSKDMSTSANNTLVVGDDDDIDEEKVEDDVLKIIMVDESDISVNTECCTIDGTIQSSGNHVACGSSQDECGPPEDEGFELSYDQAIRHTHP